MPQKNDFIVVGAGIAGIAIAEILQRSGQHVLLLEAENILASVASSQHQSWFHTGALYAAFPNNNIFKSLIRNLNCIRYYYNGFPNMNLGQDQCIFDIENDGWFGKNRTFYFYVSPAEKEISLYKKPFWYLATLIAKSRLAWFDSIDLSGKINRKLSRLYPSFGLSRSNKLKCFDSWFERAPTVLISYDRLLNSTLIINDLIKSFLYFGGTIKLKSKVKKINKNTLVINDSECLEAKNIILTTGKALKYFVGNDRIRVIKSPMLVVAPALSDVNFVRLSINPSKIFNHYCHETSEGYYSVIGNAEYYKENELIDLDVLKFNLLNEANKFFGTSAKLSNSELFFGYKTELPNIGQLRNYLYHFVEQDNHIIALPGKLSFAFSLAVQCCQYFGIDPQIKIPLIKIEQPYPICDPLHQSIASTIYETLRDDA